MNNFPESKVFCPVLGQEVVILRLGKAGMGDCEGGCKELPVRGRVHVVEGKVEQCREDILPRIEPNFAVDKVKI